MLVKGKYGTAEIYADPVDHTVKQQVERLLDQDFTEDAKIRIMPDCHAGLGCVIGYTQELTDKIIPNIVGVDIGCGMLTIPLGNIEIPFEKLDETIRKFIPAGFKVQSSVVKKFPALDELIVYDKLENLNRLRRSIGSLGGGNHFIEMNEDENGDKYLVIHSGSRNLGTQIAKIYQDKATRNLGKEYPKDLCYLEGEDMKNYLHDMDIVTEFAKVNRETMGEIILEKVFGLKLEDTDYFHTVHNTIDQKDRIIRKGAIPSRKGELLLIPINMRDGSLLCLGKGNEDWNQSAPHGAGRRLSRTQARKELCLNTYRSHMKDVWTSSVRKGTLDEAPDAYKPKEEILENLDETCDVLHHLKAIYNFKA